MAVLRESPWYQEILEEGLEEGREQGLEQARREDLQRVLVHRFGELPAEIEEGLQGLSLKRLERLFDLALSAQTLDEFRTHLATPGDGQDGRDA